jgi:hypothetical protein
VRQIDPASTTFDTSHGTIHLILGGDGELRAVRNHHAEQETARVGSKEIGD